VRVALAVGLGVLAVLAAPATAGAHIRSGRTAVDYRATISTSPAGVTARIFFDVLEHYEEPVGGTIRSGRSNPR
jgi:hypothetical protein